MPVSEPIVLIIDDDRSDRAELTALAWNAGFRAATAARSELLPQLLSRFEDHPRRVLVLAVEFGGNRGGDWLADLSRRPPWRDVPLIVVTRSPASTFAQALRLSAVPVVGKPIQHLEFRQALADIGCQPGVALAGFAAAAAMVLQTAQLRQDHLAVLRRSSAAVRLARSLRRHKLT